MLGIGRRGFADEREPDFVYDRRQYIFPMQRKIFWMVFVLLGLLADFLLPFWWALGATIPALFIAWWVAYRSDWF